MLPILLAVASAAALASARNVSIDDTAPAWVYDPPGNWGIVSASNPCTTCASQPDPSLAHSQTWRDCSSTGTATLTFTGTAVTIYTICPAPHVNGTYAANLSFTLDGKDDGTFVEPSPGCTEYKFNYPVYSVKGLANRTHTIAVTNHPDGAQYSTSDVLLDYAVIDDGTPDPSAPKSFPVAAVVVPVVVVILVALAGMFWFFRHRRGARRVKRYDAEPTPFKAPSLTSIPLTPTRTVHIPGHGNAGSPGQSYSSSGQDPELQAAFAVIAARSGSTLQSSTVVAPAFSRDRKRPTPQPEFAHPPAYAV